MAYSGFKDGEVNDICPGHLQVLLFLCRGAVRVPHAQQSLAPTPATPAQSTDVEGGSEFQQALLREIVSGTRPTSIRKIVLVPSSRGGLTLEIHAPDRSLRTLWQGWLIAGAFRDRLKAAGHPTAISLRDGDSNGAALPPELGVPPKAAKPEDVASARRTFRAAAAAIGSRLDELTIYRPDGVAVAATLESADPARFLVHQMPRFLAALGDRWADYDGTYIRLVDSSGSTVWESSTNARTPTGAVGVREDIAGCSPIANYGPTPPACPAK